MSINVTLCSNKTKSYDLTNAGDVTAFKRLITVAINGNDTTRLTTIKTQLQAIPNKSAVELEQLN